MSLFGTSPTGESPSMSNATINTKSRASLFDDDDNGSITRSTSDTLFNDDDEDRSPWDMPTPRKQQTRAELLRGLLAGVQVPDSYIEAFDNAIVQEGRGSRLLSSAGITKTIAAARLNADQQVRIMNIIAPSGGDVSLGRDEFHVLLALIALAQEGDTLSLDSVDERRRSKSCFFLLCSFSCFLSPNCSCASFLNFPSMSFNLLLSCCCSLSLLHIEPCMCIAPIEPLVYANIKRAIKEFNEAE
jgi:hypothetical protein